MAGPSAAPTRASGRARVPSKRSRRAAGLDSSSDSGSSESGSESDKSVAEDAPVQAPATQSATSQSATSQASRTQKARFNERFNTATKTNQEVLGT